MQCLLKLNCYLKKETYCTMLELAWCHHLHANSCPGLSHCVMVMGKIYLAYPNFLKQIWACKERDPDSKVHGVNMGPTWGRQEPGWPHAGAIDLANWGDFCYLHITIDMLLIWRMLKNAGKNQSQKVGCLFCVNIKRLNIPYLTVFHKNHLKRRPLMMYLLCTRLQKGR